VEEPLAATTTPYLSLRFLLSPYYFNSELVKFLLLKHIQVHPKYTGKISASSSPYRLLALLTSVVPKFVPPSTRFVPVAGTSSRSQVSPI
jgi:hypothetical protein